jgi:hypothetical protein
LNILQGDFDYSQLTFPTAEGLYTEEPKEDLRGVGDSLDALLDVLPGKDAALESQADEYAEEIMLDDFSGQDEVEQEAPDQDPMTGDFRDDDLNELDF